MSVICQPPKIDKVFSIAFSSDLNSNDIVSDAIVALICARVETCLTKITSQVKNILSNDLIQYNNSEVKIKVVSNTSSDFNLKCANLAVELGLEVNLLTAAVDSKNILASYQKLIGNAQLIVLPEEVLKGKQCQRGDRLKNEITLAFSDVLIAVWDGRNVSATLELMIQALIARKTVIWINLDGGIQISNNQSLNDETLFALDSRDFNLHPFIEIFKPWDGKPIGQINQLINPLDGQYIKDKSNNKSSEKQLEMYFNKTLHYSRIELVLIYCLKLKLVYGIFLAKGFLGKLIALTKTSNTLVDNLSSKIVDSDNVAIKNKAFFDRFLWSDVLSEHAASMNRGTICYLYLMASFAVLCAASGEVWPCGIVWPALELLCISFIIILYYFSKKYDWHKNWLSHRFISEQFRYLIMGYPLMAVSSIFTMPLWVHDKDCIDSSSSTSKDTQMMLVSHELWLLQRSLVAEGFPFQAESGLCEPSKYCSDVVNNCVLTDMEKQIQYHKNNHLKLKNLENRYSKIMIGLFFITFFAVLSHFCVHLKMLLIFTTFCPALGAAIHAILVQLEIGRVSKLSEETGGVLNSLVKSIDIIQKEPYCLYEDISNAKEDQYIALRELSVKAAQVMSDENNEWYKTILHRKTELPA